MRYVAAYLLASLSGKEPSSDDIEKILSSVGIESDAEKLKLVLKELKGKNVDDLIESGKYFIFHIGHQYCKLKTFLNLFKLSLTTTIDHSN